MSATTDSIKSVQTINKDYRRAIVDGRRFDMMRITGRGGPISGIPACGAPAP